MLRLVVGADEELQLLLLLLADDLPLPFLEIVSQPEGAEDQEDGGGQELYGASASCARGWAVGPGWPRGAEGGVAGRHQGLKKVVSGGGSAWPLEAVPTCLPEASRKMTEPLDWVVAVPMERPERSR